MRARARGRFACGICVVLVVRMDPIENDCLVRGARARVGGTLLLRPARAHFGPVVYLPSTPLWPNNRGPREGRRRMRPWQSIVGFLHLGQSLPVLAVSNSPGAWRWPPPW